MGYVERLLATNEEIVIRSRQHWIVLLGSLLTNSFFVVVLIALAIFIQISSTVPVDARLIASLIAVALAVIPVVSLLRRYMVWSNEEYIVTNRRVIQVEGVFSKHVLDSSLDKINDVSLTQSLLGRVVGYGNIEILTASEIGVNQFPMIADPVKFKMAMMNQKSMGGDSRNAEREGGGSDVPSLIKKLEELHQQGVLTDQEYTDKKAQLLARI